MKYNKPNSLKNLILILLACALVLTFSACGDEEIAESSVAEETSQPLELTLDEAKALIERDRLITDMFVNNSLCSKKTAEYAPVISFNEYSDYGKLLSLLENTYTASGGNIQTFLSYPNERLPAIKSINGRTNVFNHIGSSFEGFVNDTSVSVSDTEDEAIKTIAATSKDGKQVEFTAKHENGKWLLEKGIFLLNPPAEDEFTKEFPNTSLGSFIDFTGEVLVIELFVSDYQTQFTPDEEDVFHEKLENAFGYIQEQSETFGNEVNITYERIYYEYSGIIGVRPLDFDIVFAETGFGTLQKFADANYDLTAYDNYVIAVCINKEAETSYALYDGTNETEIYFGERVILGKNALDTDICVSLLSLLGAYGYNEGVCDEYTEALYRKYFPNDIMVSESLVFSEMSPVTAYACGITEELSPLYQVFYYD